MKLALLFSLLLCTFMPSYGVVRKAIYGNDDRVETFSPLLRAIHLKAIRATAVQVNKRLLSDFENTAFYKLIGKPYETLKGLCPGEEERFRSQLAGLDCSGFLISDDLLVTAAHCMQGRYRCDGYKWIFDYRSSLLHGGSHAYVEKENVYGCKEVVSISKNPDERIDYAIVKLDRKALARPHLKLQTQSLVDDDAKLFAVGFPVGLPMKVSLNGKIRDNSAPHYFLTDLDTFVSNSGSAVINEKSGLVEGILIRGQTDFKRDPVNKCTRVVHCAEGECDGESVMRASSISGL